jgi:hypothetical protein
MLAERTSCAAAQIPYTVAKFVVFEHVAHALHAHAAALAALPLRPGGHPGPPGGHPGALPGAALSPAAAAGINLAAIAPACMHFACPCR